MSAAVAEPQAVDRQAAVRAILRHLAEAPIDDKRIGLLLAFTRKNLPQLSGPTFRLSDANRQEIASQIRRNPHPAAGLFARLALFALDACASGEDEALVLAITDVLSDALLSAIADPLRSNLNRFSLGASPSRDTLEQIRQLILSRPCNLQQLIACFKLSGLTALTPVETRHAVFNGLVLPIMQSAWRKLGTNAMLSLEQLVYNNYIKIEERFEHHKETFAALEPIFKQLAINDNRNRPPLPAASVRPRVAFILHNGAKLAHTDLLITLLRGIRKLENPPIDPAICLLTGAHKEQLAPICDELAIPLLVDNVETNGDIVARFDRCRALLQQHQVSAVVFVSVTLHLCYLAWAPIAPVQIWLKMKFALPNFEGLDGRVIYSSMFQRNDHVIVDGAVWRSGPMGITPPPIASDEAVRAVRATYSYRKIIGTVAREEKIREPAFLEAAIRILQRHKDVGFLWTGRVRLPEIEAAFQTAGVADRCHFVGWVDPAIYCRVFDIFLETFPLTGLMAAWAMHLGIPVISVSDYGYLGLNLLGVYDGSISVSPGERREIDTIFAPVTRRFPFPWAETPDQIGDFADALLDDDDFAADFGRSAQQFVQTYLCDPLESSRIQAQNFANIIAEYRAANSTAYGDLVVGDRP
jgi:glycosyltransferase involved in cell wall biosynthesis